MHPRIRRVTIDPIEVEAEAALDHGEAEETLLAREEESALDHGSVETICGRSTTDSRAEAELVSREEDAALDHGSVDRIATKRPPARPSP
jgi:hypothetical protein